MALPGFLEHPKFKRLVYILREPTPHVWGYCECLWHVAYQNGNPVIGDEIDVSLAAQYPGEPGKLIAAMLAVRLIDETEVGKFQVHDLHENAPDYVRKRFARDQARKNKYAPRKRRKPELGGPIQQKSELGGPIQQNECADDELGRTTRPDQKRTEETSSLSPGKPASKAKSKPRKKPRPRDELFDVIAELTGSDPKVSGSHVGKVAASLRDAEPPYTPAEVRALPSALQAAGLSVPLTLGVVEKYIGWTRTKPQTTEGTRGMNGTGNTVGRLGRIEAPPGKYAGIVKPLRVSEPPPTDGAVPHYLTNKPRQVAEIDKPLRETIRKLVVGEMSWPLLLLGPAGTGKTCAALCLLDHAGGLYFTTAGLCETLIQAQQGRLTTPATCRIMYPESLWSELATTALVVLDELGAREKVSEFHYDTVKRLLDEREGRPLVCLSNLGIEALARIYDDRVTSRLAAGTAVAIEGQDRRLSTGSQER